MDTHPARAAYVAVSCHTTDAPDPGVWLKSGIITDTSSAAVASGEMCRTSHHGCPPNGTLGTITVAVATVTAGATSASMYSGGDLLASSTRYFTTSHMAPTA